MKASRPFVKNQVGKHVLAFIVSIQFLPSEEIYILVEPREGVYKCFPGKCGSFGLAERLAADGSQCPG